MRNKYAKHYGIIVDMIVGVKVSRSDAKSVLELINTNPKMRGRVMKAFAPGITAVKEGLKELAEKPRSRTRTKK